MPATSRIGIGGVTSPLARLHIDQASTTGAIPTLYLDQGDVSEEIIRLRGTAASSVVTNTFVAAADVTTATLAGYFEVYILDDGNQITDASYYVPFYTLV